MEGGCLFYRALGALSAGASACSWTAASEQVQQLPQFQQLPQVQDAEALGRSERARPFGDEQQWLWEQTQ